MAYLPWSIPQDGGILRFPAVPEPWAPGGDHLLIFTEPACPQTRSDPQQACIPAKTYEVYDWPGGNLVLTIPPLGPNSFSEVRWAGSNALFVRDSSQFFTLDGDKTPVPSGLGQCCASFAVDQGVAIDSATAGEDCSLIDASTGSTLVGVPRSSADTNDTGICQHVSWTRDRSFAIATGVSTP